MDSIYKVMRKTIMLACLLALFGCGNQEKAMPGLPVLNRETDLKLFYPVLRNYEASDVFAKTVVHHPIADGLAVFV